MTQLFFIWFFGIEDVFVLSGDNGQIVSPRHGKYKLATTGPENCVFYPGYREPIYGEEIIGCIEEGEKKLCIRCSGPRVGKSE